MTNKSRNRSKLHVVTKLHEGIKFYKAKTKRRDKITRRKFLTQGQICTSYNFAPRVIFVLEKKKEKNTIKKKQNKTNTKR